MERPREEKVFEIAKFGAEVLNEWYAERDFVNVETEPKPEKVKDIQLLENRTPEIKKVISEEQEKRGLIKEKIKELLSLGEKKGLVHAIKKAERSNDPFLLDVFHDILVKDGNYKKILKK